MFVIFFVLSSISCNISSLVYKIRIVCLHFNVYSKINAVAILSLGLLYFAFSSLHVPLFLQREENLLINCVMFVAENWS